MRHRYEMYGMGKIVNNINRFIWCIIYKNINSLCCTPEINILELKKKIIQGVTESQGQIENVNQKNPTVSQMDEATSLNRVGETGANLSNLRNK